VRACKEGASKVEKREIETKTHTEREKRAWGGRKREESGLLGKASAYRVYPGEANRGKRGGRSSMVKNYGGGRALSIIRYRGGGGRSLQNEG